MFDLKHKQTSIVAQSSTYLDIGIGNPLLIDVSLTRNHLPQENIMSKVGLALPS